MPTIVAANPKGGCGKSTSCLVLATTLAGQGASVRVIDADPQQSIAKWGRSGESKYRSLVVSVTPGDDLVDVIDKLAAEVQFVIIDVQGAANQEMAAAMSRADLVLIPMQAKTLDADEAPRAINLLRSQEKLFKRSIPFGIVFMRTSTAVPTREEKHIRESIRKAKIPCFSTALNERTAFSQMFSQRLALNELEPADVNGLPAAKENAAALTGEVIEVLRNGWESAA